MEHRQYDGMEGRNGEEKDSLFILELTLSSAISGVACISDPLQHELHFVGSSFICCIQVRRCGGIKPRLDELFLSKLIRCMRPRQALVLTLISTSFTQDRSATCAMQLRDHSALRLRGCDNRETGCTFYTGVILNLEPDKQLTAFLAKCGHAMNKK